MMQKTVKIFWNKAMSAYKETILNPSRKQIYDTLCLFRGCAVRLIEEYCKVQESGRQFQRMAKQFPKPELSETVTISIVNPYFKMEKQFRNKIAEIGGIFFFLLDEWQKYGATYDELRTFCNGCGTAWFDRISDTGSTNFADIVCISYADYKELGDWIKTIPEAPLTICMKEYMLYQMMHTEHGKQAAEYALHKVFPELEEKLLYRCTDAEGNEFFVNQDGEIISEIQNNEE